MYGTTEVSVHGKWIQVPSFECGGHTILTTRKWLKIAVVHDEAWIPTELQNPEECIALLKKAPHPRADIFTFSQLPPGHASDYPYFCDPDPIAVARVDNYKAWWEGLPQETRKNVRRSAKYGVSIEVKPFCDEVIRDIVTLNNSSPIRQGRRYTHYGKSFEQVKKDHESFEDRSDFICAYHEGNLVGYIKLVFRGQVASILNILADENHKERRVANVLVQSAIEQAHKKGATYVTYGFFRHGNKQDETITLFKVRHGFAEVKVPRFFVPITLWGKLAIACGWHRGPLGALPGSVLSLRAALRAKWYTWKLSLKAGVAQ